MSYVENLGLLAGKQRKQFRNISQAKLTGHFEFLVYEDHIFAPFNSYRTIRANVRKVIETECSGRIGYYKNSLYFFHSSDQAFLYLRIVQLKAERLIDDDYQDGIMAFGGVADYKNGWSGA